MRAFRIRQWVAAGVLSSLFGMGAVAWPQDNSGQNNNPSQVQKPARPQPIGGPGVDTAGPFNSQNMNMQGTYGQSQGSTPGLPSALPPDIETPPHFEHDQAKMRNQDRQKQLVQDTQKLLALATELKTDVDKSNKDMLSLDVVRKAEEIEKLARSVKDKMKGS